MKTYIAVGGLIIKNEEILLVNQNNSFHDKNYWSLPGGKVEFGEPIEDALSREIKEETGLKILNHQLIFTSQVYHKKNKMRVFGFNFLINKWEGNIINNDPDNSVTKVCFFIKNEAIKHLKNQPWNSDAIIEFINKGSLINDLPFSIK